MATTSYLNFDLELAKLDCGPDGRWTYAVRAANTPRAQVQSVEEADRVEVGAGDIDKAVGVLARRWDVPEDEFGRACRALEQWLLPASSRARALLEASLAGLGGDESILLRLRCRDERLARLPWEFAAFDIARLPDDGRFHADRMLAMQPRICIVRFEELTAPVERRQQGVPRLLFATAAPPELEQLALHVERARIEAALADASPRPEASWIEHATIGKLQQSLLDARFDVFQFSGHGGSSRGGFLCLEREELSDGTFEAEKLGLALSGKGVRLAVLAACVSAQVEAELPWSSVARALVAGGVPAVVGMQLNVDDRSALEFLSTFYHALAASLPLGAAVTEARKRIGLYREIDRDFGVPVLYLRNAEGWDGVIFPPARPESPVERGVRAADAYKRLHDALHKAKMDAFHLIMGYANDFPPKASSSQRTLRSYVNTIKRCVSEMRSIAAEGHCDRDLVTPLVDALDQATAQLESAVTHLDRDSFIDTLPQLNSVFSRDMSMLDVSLHNKTKELPLHDTLRAATPREFAELQQFIEQMKLRVVTHHACQRLEDLLDDLRDPRNADTVSASALRRRQKDIRALMESCLGALNKERADSLTALARALDESLAASDPERLATAFEDFRATVGMAFYEIDSELKKMCGDLCKDPRLVTLATS